MASQPPNTDDLFASLGGSLMKDLWADLQAGDTEEDDAMMGWSLEQLERELAHLEDEGPVQQQLPPPGMPSAASLVVSHAQERMVGQPSIETAPTTADDAWSQSLQNFTGSLEQDFLAADSARKQTVKPMYDEDLLKNVQEYNVSEVATVQPPPGLIAATAPPPSRPPGMPSPAQKVEIKEIQTQEIPPPPMQEEEPSVPPRRRLPPTPQNSAVSMGEVSHRRVPPTPQNSQVGVDDYSPSMTPIMAKPVVMTPIVQQQPIVQPQPMVQQQPMVEQQQPMVQQQQQPMVQQPQPMVQQPKQPAWQSQPVMQQPPTRPVYCQPDPAAPPIPSAALESSLMKPRDLSYVLHSMLKPILVAGMTPDDYDILYWERRSGRMQNRNKSKHSKRLEKEMASRSQRSKDWMAEHKALGHVAKSDVTRPRALIAVHTAAEEEAPNKERATLWKARIYVDQGYQAYFAVVKVWRAAPPGSGVPRQIQPHLVKLLKCLGVKLEAPPSSYSVDETALSLVLKLPKGQTLLARILEQALLPPNAVQALLPVALSIAIHSSFDDVRLFRSFATVISSLPNLQPTCLLQCVKAVETTEALSSTPRMECVHALLRRGSHMATQDASFAPEWAKTEQEFMKLLS